MNNYNLLFFINYLNHFFNKLKLNKGSWGLGIGDWAQSPIRNPQSPIPNPHQKFHIINKNQYKLIFFVLL